MIAECAKIAKRAYAKSDKKSTHSTHFGPFCNIILEAFSLSMHDDGGKKMEGALSTK